MENNESVYLLNFDDASELIQFFPRSANYTRMPEGVDGVPSSRPTGWICIRSHRSKSVPRVAAIYAASQEFPFVLDGVKFDLFDFELQVTCTEAFPYFPLPRRRFVVQLAGEDLISFAYWHRPKIGSDPQCDDIFEEISNIARNSDVRRSTHAFWSQGMDKRR